MKQSKKNFAKTKFRVKRPKSIPKLLCVSNLLQIQRFYFTWKRCQKLNKGVKLIDLVKLNVNDARFKNKVKIIKGNIHLK